MSAVIVDSSDDDVASPTWFSGDDEPLSEDKELAEVADCNLAFRGQVADDSHGHSGWPLNGIELQSSPVRTFEVEHSTVPEPMSAAFVDSHVSLDAPNEQSSRLSRLDVERRATYIAEHSKDIVFGPHGKRSSMVEWLKLIQSDGNSASSPPSSPESSLPATPSSLFSPLPDFGNDFEHGFKSEVTSNVNYTAYDSVIIHTYDVGGDFPSF